MADTIDCLLRAFLPVWMLWINEDEKIKNMNTIKFRVWDEDSKMYKENLFLSSDGGNFLYFQDGKIFANSLVGSPFKVEQYTTFEDRNGKSIFVGDIVKIQYALNEHAEQTEEDIEQIVFEFGVFGSVTESMLDYRIKPKCSITVIGNINQNPELLNK